MTDDRSLREPLTAHLQRQTSLAIQLADQLQSRAQVTWSVIAILQSGIAVAVSANPDIAKRIDSLNMRGQAVAACAALLLALGFSLCAAVPRRMPFTSESWLRDNLVGDLLDMPFPEESFGPETAPLLDQVTATEIDWFTSVRSASTTRAKLLIASIVCLGLAGSLGAWIAVVSLRSA